MKMYAGQYKKTKHSRETSPSNQISNTPEMNIFKEKILNKRKTKWLTVFRKMPRLICEQTENFQQITKLTRRQRDLGNETGLGLQLWTNQTG